LLLRKMVREPISFSITGFDGRTVENFSRCILAFFDNIDPSTPLESSEMAADLGRSSVGTARD